LNNHISLRKFFPRKSQREKSGLTLILVGLTQRKMVRLKSRTQCPVNGFQFVDAKIAPQPLKTWDFEGLVQQVRARRLSNPRFELSTDLAVIRQEVDEQNALRMLSVSGADSYIISDAGGPAPNRLAPRSLRHGAEVAGGGVKRAVSGMGVLKDWLGEGGVPVDGEKATARALICATCPKNAKGDWTTFFTQPVAALIRQQLSIRGDLELETRHDDALNVCEACGCPLKLKVHVPINHIAAHTGDEVKGALDPRCWILAEIK
jgi:hypothetical protein